MSIRTISIRGALLSAVVAAPGIANASLVLDTGTPTSNTGSPVSVLSTSQWVAAEFNVASTGVEITNIAAYLTQGSGNVGDKVTIDIYSSSGFLNSRTLSPLYSVTDTFTTNGWNSVDTAWTPTTAGNYWVAVQVSSTSQTRGLDLPGAGISTTSGTASALAFAYAGTNHQYSVSTAAPFGIQVTETPVPLPAAAWLLLSGIGGVGAFARKRRL